MQNCNCSFTQTELSKFAPFDRYEAGYSNKVSTNLFELGINCSNCKYFGKNFTTNYSYEEMENYAHEKYHHCHVICGPISSNGFCRFWTNETVIEEYSQPNKIVENTYSELCKKELSLEEFDNSLDSLVNNLSNRCITATEETKPMLTNNEVIND